MVWHAVEQVEALKTRFRALESANKPEDEARMGALVWMISFLQERPRISESEYRTELARVMDEGPTWPEIRFEA